MACITGGIAQAFYKKIPTEIIDHVKTGLTKDLLDVLDEFNEKYGCEY